MKGLLFPYLTSLLVALSMTMSVMGQAKWVHDVLNLRDGLAESRIRRLAELPDGRLVVATAGVVSIYDGTRFHPYHLLPENGYPLPDYHAYRNLMCDSDGRIWLHNTGELHVIVPQAEGYVANVDSIFGRIGWQGDSIRNFYVDNTFVSGETSSRYWIVTKERELYCCEDGNCRRVIGLDELGHGIPERILSEGNTAYLCHHTGHVYRLQWDSAGKTPARVVSCGTPLKEKFASSTRHGIEAMLFDGKLWLTLNLKDERHSYIARLDTARGEWLPNIALLMRISTCALSPDSLLHVVGNRGIYVLSADGQIREHRRLQPVMDAGVADTLKEDISSILFDQFGSTWTGTSENGLLHHRPGRKELIKASEESYPHRPAKSFYSEKIDSLAEVYAQGITNCSYEDAEGTVYLGTRKGVIVISPEGKLATCLNGKDGLASVNIQAMVSQGDSVLWVSTTTGISRIVKDNGCFKLMHYGRLDGLNLRGRELRVGEMFLNEADTTICVGISGGTFCFSPNELARSPRYVFHHTVQTENGIQHPSDTKTGTLASLLFSVVVFGIGIYCYNKKRGKCTSPSPEEDSNGDESVSSPEEDNNMKAPVLSGDDRHFLEKLQSLTKQHIGDETFTVQALAQEMAMDRTVLFRRMQQIVGLSPSAYIRKERMDEAARLLRETEIPMNEIASQIGFSDVKYFARIFKTTFGVSPREYRGKASL